MSTSAGSGHPPLGGEAAPVPVAGSLGRPPPTPGNAAIPEAEPDVNPHIPQYMSKQPWYLDQSAPKGPTGMSHHRDWRAAARDSVEARPVRRVVGARTTRYRKGACENCGSMTHGKVDCLERPRAPQSRAQFADPSSGRLMGADEEVSLPKFATYDGKRDRHAAVDVEGAYKRAAEQYERRQELVMAAAERRAAVKGAGAGPSTSAVGALDADPAATAAADGAAPDGAAPDGAAPGAAGGLSFARVEKRVRAGGGAGAGGSVRNLRIREDTAKYLINLDLDSAHYDPKSRSMRQDPRADPAGDAPVGVRGSGGGRREVGDGPRGDGVFRGENAERGTGEYAEWLALQAQAQGAYARGSDMHATAAPSQAELMRRAYLERKANLVQRERERTLGAYGADAAAQEAAAAGGSGAKPLDADDADAAVEGWVEYDGAGRVLGAGPSAGPAAASAIAAAALTRYDEDVHPGSHRSCYGSWYRPNAADAVTESGALHPTEAHPIHGVGEWGYACCRQTVRNAYCTGEAGRRAETERRRREMDNIARVEAKRAERAERETMAGGGADAAVGGGGAVAPHRADQALWGGASGTGPGDIDAVVGAATASGVDLDAQKLEAALAREDARRRCGGIDVDDGNGDGDKKGERNSKRPKYCSLRGDAGRTTAEDMEAYRLRRVRPDDPMARGGAAGAGDDRAGRLAGEAAKRAAFGGSGSGSEYEEAGQKSADKGEGREGKGGWDYV